MGSIMIAMPKAEDAGRIAKIIKNQGILQDISICQTGNEVLRLANERDYGVVICTKSLKDMQYAELADMMPDFFGMIVLTSDVSLEVTSKRMLKLLLPFKSGELLSAVELFSQAFYRQLRKKKKAPLRRSEEEQHLVDAAKEILMVKNGMSEPEAFRYIQKNSMDTGRSLVESAQMILVLLQN